MFSPEWGAIHGLPVGWFQRRPEEVAARIEKELNEAIKLNGGKASLSDIEDATKELKKAALDLKGEIQIILSALDAGFLSEADRKVLDEIEAFTFGRSHGDILKGGLPTQVVSRDSTAVYQGLTVPSHLYYEAVARAAESLTDAIEDFLKLNEGLVRRFKLRASIGAGVKLEGAEVGSPLGNLHPQIQSKCMQLYRSGSYAEAVEKGFKVVRDRLRALTGFERGSEAFGRGKLHIKGAAAANVDKDFNEAVKFLTMAIDNFRNEKSHTSDAKITDPHRAYEYLVLSSLAMSLLEDAEITS